MALNGQVAVVTGAAMGIGRAITEILLQNGAKVQFGLILQNYLSGFLFWSNCTLIILTSFSYSLSVSNTGNCGLFCNYIVFLSSYWKL